MRLLMLGTKDFALPTFQALCESRHEVIALITQPDRPQGRKQEVIFSAIKNDAMARGLPIHQPEDINAPEGVELLRSLQADILVTAAYGQILSPTVLGVTPRGGVNLHGSILPRYRGAAPVARAIQRGDSETGVTVIQMSPRVDAGGMIAVARTPIEPNETAAALEARLADLGAPLMVETLDRLEAGTVEILPQDQAQATRAPKLSRDDGRIDWSRPAQAIHNLVRAMQPWPQAFSFWQPVESSRPALRLIIHESRPESTEGPAGQVLEAQKDRLVIAAGQGSLALLQIQVPGKRAMSAAEFLRGNRVAVGDRFVSNEDEI